MAMHLDWTWTRYMIDDVFMFYPLPHFSLSSGIMEHSDTE